MNRKGVFDMAHTVNVNIKMDEDVKKRMERACAEMGLSMSAAFTMFAKKVGREYRIPFEVSADPFFGKQPSAPGERHAGCENWQGSFCRA
jgi:addiction module RelB/DinJ family antitoxin